MQCVCILLCNTFNFFYFHIIIVQYIISGVHTEQRSQLITLPRNLLEKIDTLPPNLLEKIDTTLQLDGPPFTAEQLTKENDKSESGYNEISENGRIFFFLQKPIYLLKSINIFLSIFFYC